LDYLQERPAIFNIAKSRKAIPRNIIESNFSNSQSQFSDAYREQVQKLIGAKAHGKKLTVMPRRKSEAAPDFEREHQRQPRFQKAAFQRN
jgi:non-homologous end joining protein Ku